MKPQKIKVQKQQILNYLNKRYGPRLSKKVVNNFCFQNNMSFEEYCECIDNFIKRDTMEKREFGFKIHDMNNDGKIDPIDMIGGRIVLGFKIRSLYNLHYDLLMIESLM